MFIKIFFWKIGFQWFQPSKKLFSKIGDGKVVTNLFAEKMTSNLLESHNF